MKPIDEFNGMLAQVHSQTLQHAMLGTDRWCHQTFLPIFGIEVPEKDGEAEKKKKKEQAAAAQKGLVLRISPAICGTERGHCAARTVR